MRKTKDEVTGNTSENQHALYQNAYNRLRVLGVMLQVGESHRPTALKDCVPTHFLNCDLK